MNYSVALKKHKCELRYFYNKRSIAKKQRKKIRFFLSILKNRRVKNVTNRLLLGENIEYLESCIQAYTLRIRWCSLNIKNHKKYQQELELEIQELSKTFDNYFESIEQKSIDDILGKHGLAA
jgi:predicted transcriptional regulator